MVLPAGAVARTAAGVVTVKMALPVAPTVGTTPLSKSLPNMLPAFGVPVAPLIPVLKVSSAATRAEATTVMVSVIRAQFGPTLSHSL